MDPTTDVTEHDRRRRRRRRTAVKLGLGVVALLGIGAGVTSAAWSDDAVFTTGASSASVALKAWDANNNGCAAAPVTPVQPGNACWKDADTSTGAVTITDTGFVLTGLVPNANGTDKTLSTTLYVYNSGTASVKVTAACTGTGEVFTGTSPLLVTLDTATAQTTNPCKNWAGVTLAPGLTTAQSVSLKVTVPGAWPSTYMGKTGSSLAVAFTGTAG